MSEKFTVITAIARLASIAQALQMVSLGGIEVTSKGYLNWSDELSEIADLFADEYDTVKKQEPQP